MLHSAAHLRHDLPSHTLFNETRAGISPCRFGCSYFLRLLLDKKYALPYRVLDALVAHFVNFLSDDRQLPVVWHQALLCFVQR